MDQTIIESIKNNAEVLTGAKSDYDSLMQMIGDARFVLIGEASHGTKEFYHIRAEITQRLITEKDFTAVAIEGDWPDTYHVNRYVSARNHSGGARQALSKFERFPTWMWQNKEVLRFVKWLRAHNNAYRDKYSIGFYGLDLYSMSTSINAVIAYLKIISPEAAKRARNRYSCLDRFMDDPQTYGYLTDAGLAESCEEDILKQLIDLRQHAFEYIQRDGFVAEDEFFYVEQNAKLVKDAEEYYRSLYWGEPSSWNLRDSHMMGTLEDLAAHLGKRLKKPAKLVVWAHNSHIGDARATEMSKRGELNIGQLAREKYNDEAFLIGFSTYDGTVTAASDWGAPMERKTVLPALPKSHSDLFHRTGKKNFVLNLQNKELIDHLQEPLLQRFIGVIYSPDTERMSHYYHAILPKQFDAIIHIDKTNAVEPLKVTPHWHRGELDETYPFGI